MQANECGPWVDVNLSVLDLVLLLSLLRFDLDLSCVVTKFILPSCNDA